MDDDQKKFIPKLAIDTEFFFIAHLPNLVRCKTKGAVGALCTLPRNWQLDVTLKGSRKMGDGRICSKNLRAYIFNDDLSNESNFSLPPKKVITNLCLNQDPGRIQMQQSLVPDSAICP
jgi:hypothetical protein